MAHIDELYEEYVRSWHAGRAPDAAAFLARAADRDRDGLAAMIETFLIVAPSVEPVAERAEELRADPAFLRALAIADGPATPAWGARLRSARESAGMSLADLGTRFAAAFGLAGRESRAATMLAALESGDLAASGVSERAADRLASLLGQTAGAFRPPPPAAALFRAEEDAADDLAGVLAGAAAAMSLPAGQAWDELDDLLRGAG